MNYFMAIIFFISVVLLLGFTIDRIMSFCFRDKKSKTKEPKTPITIGSKWIFKGEDESPWSPKEGYRPVEILDYKEGWVRYTHGRNSPFQDERDEEDCFISLYKPYLED